MNELMKQVTERMSELVSKQTSERATDTKQNSFTINLWNQYTLQLLHMVPWWVLISTDEKGKQNKYATHYYTLHIASSFQGLF